MTSTLPFPLSVLSHPRRRSSHSPWGSRLMTKRRKATRRTSTTRKTIPWTTSSTVHGTTSSTLHARERDSRSGRRWSSSHLTSYTLTAASASSGWRDAPRTGSSPSSPHCGSTGFSTTRASLTFVKSSNGQHRHSHTWSTPHTDAPTTSTNSSLPSAGAASSSVSLASSPGRRQTSSHSERPSKRTGTSQRTKMRRRSLCLKRVH
mmetsp:Transcript_8894/g.25628  ORF Transcript_8894/g.25628 Transcript_8894/m.25628 type:complete len:205 (+) Transcript_8894:681-1295(+)